jgi:hypothetical protein
MRWLWTVAFLTDLDFRCHTALGEAPGAAVNANILPDYLTSIGKEYGCEWVRGEVGKFVCSIAQVHGQIEFSLVSITSGCSVEMTSLILKRIKGSASIEVGEQLAQRLIQYTAPTWGAGANKIHEYIENIRAGGDGITFDVSKTTISIHRLQPADVEDLFMDLTISGKKVCGVH